MYTQMSPVKVLDATNTPVVIRAKDWTAIGIYIDASGPGTLEVVGGPSSDISTMARMRLLAYGAGLTMTVSPVFAPYIAVRKVSGGSINAVWAIPLADAVAGQVLLGGNTGLIADIANSPVDGYVDNNSALITRAYSYLFNGTSWDRARTPTTFRTVAATAAGDTALWTPAAGKRFRLMGYVISLTANVTLAVADILTVSLVDGATPTAFVHDFYVPATVSVPFGASVVGPAGAIGNGYLSQAVGNTLSVRLSAGLATGRVRVIAWGTEE